MDKTEKVVVSLLVGGVLGGLVGAIVGRFPPITLKPEDPTPLDKSNQVFAAAGGAILGEVAGAAVALAD